MTIVEETLQKIKEDLEKHFDMEKVPYLDVFSKHFGICAYMRNKFLWNNPKLVDILNQHFKTEHVDDLSNKILDEIIKKYN